MKDINGKSEQKKKMEKKPTAMSWLLKRRKWQWVTGFLGAFPLAVCVMAQLSVSVKEAETLVSGINTLLVCLAELFHFG